MDSSTGRIVVEQGMEGKFAAIAEPVIEQLGYRLVRVKISGMNGATVQFMAERPDGTMSVEDCAAVSRALSPVLDVEDPFDRPYHLEISSPGIDRPLVRKGDFEAWTGHLIKLETERLVSGRKRFRGKVIGVGELSFQLERDQAAAGEEVEVEIPFDAVGEARLILTDELISAALKADKDARRARGEPEEADADAEDEGEPPVH